MSIRTSSLALSFLFFAAAVQGLAAEHQGTGHQHDHGDGAGTFEVAVGDRIAIVGNGLADRMQHDGWLEAMMQLRFPERRLAFRNLGFNGDTVTVRLRSSNFGSPHEWLRRVEATVVFAFFGYNESFEGDSGVAAFQDELRGYLHEVMMTPVGPKGAPRVVLFSPIAHEDLKTRFLPDGKANNQRLAAYTDAMRGVAEEMGVPFVDLFHPTEMAYAASSEPLTINGVHLNRAGNRKVAQIVVDQLFGEGPPHDETLLETTRAAVEEKNFYWFQRYRTTDGFSIYGGRRTAGGSDTTPRNEPVMMREMEILDVMTANRDGLIWSLANDEDDYVVNDNNTPEFVPVGTNKPGPLDDGAYPFLGGEEAIGKMTVAEGMAINLFASEETFPELQNPVQMAVDPDGRLWVAVWPSYPHWKPKDEMNDKLLILEDTDGDGKADVCKTFADGLHNPTGFEFANGGVYVAQIPDVWFLRDNDGDDRVDERTRVIGGIDSADTHHSINSFVMEPGGALHFQEGLFHRTQIETPYGAPVRCNDGALFRFEPKTGKVRVQASFAFPNPHGHVFTYWGQDIVHDGTGAKPILGASFSVHTNYPEKIPSPPQIYEKRTRPCSGTAILSSAHFPPENRDTLLVNNVIGFQGTLQYQLEPDGAGIKGTEIEPIVYSSDGNFRPSDVEVGGDGAVYICDWQNPLIGHLQHNLRDANRDRLHGRVYRVTYPGRPLLTPPRMSQMSVSELLELFTERDNNIRYRARLELSGRDEAEVHRALTSWIDRLDQNSSDHEHHLLEGLWLHQLIDVVNESLLDRVLASTDYRARAAAFRVVRAWRDRLSDGVEGRLRSGVHDPHPRVRMEAVLVCSDMTTPEAAEIALETARYPMDQFLEFTLRQTVRTLAIHWKPALAAGKPFASDNPAAVDYVLDHVGPQELVKMQRNATVFQALLTRSGIDKPYRLEALHGLAELRNVSSFELLATALGERAGSGQVASLADILAEWDVAELRTQADRVGALVDAGDPLVRQAALAALARVESSADGVWKLRGGESSGQYDLLKAVALIPEESVRTTFYRHVRPLMLEKPDRDVDLPAGISFSYYEQQPLSRCDLPEFEKWTPAKVGRIDTVTHEIPEGRGEWYALKLSATLRVREPGTYRFFLTSDDGSRLYINNREVIDNDGLHGNVTKTADIALEVGAHPIHITYFNGSGARSLSLQWKPPGGKRTEIPADAFGVAEDALFTAAIEAMGNIPGHDREKFVDLAPLVADAAARRYALAGLRKIAPQHWDPTQSANVVTHLIEHLRAIPAAERTSSELTAELEFARKLAVSLPRSRRDSFDSDLDALTVTVVTIKTVPHRMAYDVTKVVAQAGRDVQIVLQNPDNMPHNFVLTQAGAMAEVGLLAEATANEPAAQERGYVPKSDKILIARPIAQVAGG